MKTLSFVLVCSLHPFEMTYSHSHFDWMSLLFFLQSSWVGQLLTQMSRSGGASYGRMFFLAPSDTPDSPSSSSSSSSLSPSSSASLSAFDLRSSVCAHSSTALPLSAWLSTLPAASLARVWTPAALIAQTHALQTALAAGQQHVGEMEEWQGSEQENDDESSWSSSMQPGNPVWHLAELQTRLAELLLQRV